MGGKSGLVTFTFPPCARRLLDSMTATSPRALSAIRPPGQGGRGEQLKEREMGILFLAHQVSQNCLSDVVCSYPSAHHTAATAEGG